MGDVLSRVATTRSENRMSADESEDHALTFLGNHSTTHVHRRLSHLAYQKHGFRIREINSSNSLHSLVDGGDALATRILMSLAPKSSVPAPAHSLSRTGTTVPAPAHSLSRTGTSMMPAAPLPANSFGRHSASGVTPAATNPAHSLGRHGAPGRTALPVDSHPPPTWVRDDAHGRQPTRPAAPTSGSAENIQRRHDALHARILSLAANYPVCLQGMRKKYGLPPSGTPWPACFSAEIIDAIDVLLD
jgi:hypothetical protein